MYFVNNNGRGFFVLCHSYNTEHLLFRHTIVFSVHGCIRVHDRSVRRFDVRHSGRPIGYRQSDERLWNSIDVPRYRLASWPTHSR